MKIFSFEKIPYFLGLLFAVIALQFNYTISNILKIPILCYDFETISNSGDTCYFKKLVLKNLSLEKAITDFHIQLAYKKHSKSTITEPQIDAIPPATIIQNDPKYIDDKFVYYPIKVIQPKMSYELKYRTNEKRLEPIFSFECAQPIKMQRKSLLTFLIDNQILINFLLMLIFIILSILYTFKIKKIT